MVYSRAMAAELYGQGRGTTSGGLFGGEETKKPIGFHVMTESDPSPSVLGFLDLNRRRTPVLPLMPHDMQSRIHTALPLGSVNIGGSLFSGVSAAVQVDVESGSYFLYSVFSPTEPAKIRLDGTPFPDPGTFNRLTFMNTLIRDPLLGGRYTIAIDDDSDTVTFNDSRQGNGTDRRYPSFTLQAFQKNERIGYGLSLTEQGRLDEGLGNCPEELNALIRLTERVGVALYRAYGRDVPNKAFIIKPDPETIAAFADEERDLAEVTRRTTNNDLTGMYL